MALIADKLLSRSLHLAEIPRIKDRLSIMSSRIIFWAYWYGNRKMLHNKELTGVSICSFFFKQLQSIKKGFNKNCFDYAKKKKKSPSTDYT